MDPMTTAKVASTAGGAIKSFGNKKAQNKARKARLRQLSQGMKDFQLGSTDTGGNKFNFNKQRGWGYDLSNSGRAAQNAANRGNYMMNTLGNIAPSQARNNLVAADYKAAKNQANANQSAATRNALRTGGNLGDVARSMGSVGSSALRNTMQQNLRNGLSLQAQNANNYAQTAQNLAQNINTIQNNLQKQQANAPVQQMQLRMAMAEAAGVPKVNNMQMLGGMLQGGGQAMGNYQIGNQAMNMEAVKALLASNGGNVNGIDQQQVQQLLALFRGG